MVVVREGSGRNSICRARGELGLKFVFVSATSLTPLASPMWCAAAVLAAITASMGVGGLVVVATPASRGELPSPARGELPTPARGKLPTPFPAPLPGTRAELVVGLLAVVVQPRCLGGPVIRRWAIC